jgi:hypothetical protein
MDELGAHAPPDTVGEPKVRIHLPPAASPLRTRITPIAGFLVGLWSKLPAGGFRQFVASGATRRSAVHDAKP